MSLRSAKYSRLRPTSETDACLIPNTIHQWLRQAVAKDDFAQFGVAPADQIASVETIAPGNVILQKGFVVLGVNCSSP